MIDSVAAAHTAHRLAAHHPRTNGIRAVRLNVFHLREMDAVFVTEWEVPEQVLERVDPALREQFGALRANAFDHAYCCAEVHLDILPLVNEGDCLLRLGTRCRLFDGFLL